MTAEAAVAFPGTKFHITPTLGIDDLILDLLNKRVAHCTGNKFDCDLCRGTLRSGECTLDVPAVAQGPQIH